MGNVVDMKRNVEVIVRRFGHSFALKYRAGATPAMSDIQAALYLDHIFFSWVAVSYMIEQWEEISLDIDDERVLVTPEMLDIPASSENEIDQQFLLDAEEYVMELLYEELVTVLSRTSLNEETAITTTQDPRVIHPRTRGLRVAQMIHNHGGTDQLPDLVAIEIYDALEGMALTLADTLDDNKAISREECGSMVRAFVEETFGAWKNLES